MFKTKLSNNFWKLFYAQEQKCFYCNKLLRKKTKPSFDHFIPKSAGGTGGWSNIVLCHSKCNYKKANRLPSREEINKFNTLKNKVYDTNPVISRLAQENLAKYNPYKPTTKEST